MTRQELLNILYAERNRVEKQYTLPGWTLWAIIAALATLGWYAWELIDGGVEWTIVVMEFYALFIFYFLYECIKTFIPQAEKIPVYIKSDVETILGVLFFMLLQVGLMIAQLVIISKTYHPVIYWFAFWGLCISLLLIGSQVVAKEKGHTNFSSHWGAVIMGPLYIPIAILLVMYLFQEGYEPTSYRLSALFFVMYYLIIHVPVEEKRTLSQIDSLIHKVLYDNEEVDEKAILEELEVYIIGLRYGKYLSATKLKELKPLVNTLINYSDGLIQDLQQGNSAGVDAIIKEGSRIYINTKKQYYLLMWDVNSIYGEGKDKEKSLEHIIAVGRIAEETMKFWKIVQSTPNLDSNHNAGNIITVYQQTVGSAEMRLLIEQELVGKEKELG